MRRSQRESKLLRTGTVRALLGLRVNTLILDGVCHHVITTDMVFSS